MNSLLQPARVPGGGVFSVVELPYANGQTFKRGAVLTIASGACSETSPLTASMTNLYGIALQDAGSNPGYQAANNPTVVTGQKQTVSVAKFDATTVYEALAYSGTTQQTTAAQLAAMVGVSYGLTKLAGTNFWVVDIAKTGTSAYVVVQGYDIDTKTVRFKVIQTAIVQ